MLLFTDILGLDEPTHSNGSFELPELSEQAFNVIDLAIPDIDHLGDDMARSHVSDNLQSSPQPADGMSTGAGVDDDLWIHAAVEPEEQEGRLFSWEAFGRRPGPGPKDSISAHGLPSPYLSEADFKTYEAVYQRYTSIPIL